MVLDTNVFVYYLLKVEPHFEQARTTIAVTDALVVPESALIEFANTAWQYVRGGLRTVEEAKQALADFAELVDVVIPVPVLWAEALELACASGHPVYDTMFVVAARRTRGRVQTFDRQLCRRFPDDTWPLPMFDVR